MTNWNRVEYRGWKNCFCWENRKIKMIVTSDVGPRVIFFGSPGDDNEFYEIDEEAGSTGGNDYHFYGGHRFWTAPEDKTRSYALDNSLIIVQTNNDQLVAIAPREPAGIQKTLFIENYRGENSVKISHLLENKGDTPITLALWGLSMMHPGGTAIIPMTAKVSHSAQLTPTQSMALWGYTDITDPRWGWGEQYLFLRQDDRMETPQKIGVHSGQDWAAYLNNGTLFIKVSKYNSEATYPDFGSHFEFFTNNRFLELESLGGLTTLYPGQKLEHVEYWALYENIRTVISEEGVQEKILPLVNETLHLLDQ
jgi:hypothetical protein